MKFQYFVYTNGERSEGSTAWGVKFASLEFTPLGLVEDPLGRRSRLQRLCSDYEKLCSRLGISCGFDRRGEQEPGQFGFSLLPGWGDGCLACVYKPFQDETGRPNISLVAVLVPLQIMKKVSPHEFFARLCSQNELEAIMRPRLGGAFAGRPEMLEITDWNEDVSLLPSLAALQAETIDWEALQQAVIAVNGTVIYTKRNEPVAKRTDYPGWFESTGKPEVMPGAEIRTDLPAPAVKKAQMPGVNNPESQPAASAPVEPKTCTIPYLVVTSGEITSEKEHDIDYGVKFASPDFPDREEQTGTTLIHLTDEYRKMLESYENGSIVFERYWPEEADSLGYALLPWSGGYKLAVIFHRFIDSMEQHLRPNIGAVVMALDKSAQERFSPVQLLAFAQKQNDIVRIARPQRDESERWTRPSALEITADGESADRTISNDPSLWRLDQASILWGSVEAPYMVTNGNVVKLELKKVIVIDDNKIDVEELKRQLDELKYQYGKLEYQYGKLWRKTHLFKLIAAAVVALLLLYACVVTRSRGKLHDEIQTITQQLAENEKRNTQLQRELEQLRAHVQKK